MIVDHRELSWVGMPTAAAVPDMVSLLEQINTCPDVWYAAPDLENAFFSIPVNKDYPKQVALSCQVQQYTFTALTQGYIICPAVSSFSSQ